MIEVCKKEKLFDIIDTGIADYKQVYDLQRECLRKRQLNEIPDTLILAQHPPVFTIGRRGSRKNLLVSEDLIKRQGIGLTEADRGGDITFHGPGQLVLYPILDLNNWEKDIHLHIRRLEQVIIDFLAHYNIHGIRIPGLTGVWLKENKKIASIGIGISKWVTYHGLSININTPLSYFDMIKPCGLEACKITSVASALGRAVDINEAKEILTKSFARCYGKREDLFPPWIKKDLVLSETISDIAGLIKRFGLHTVCESASCPNRNECYSKKRVTFMILGNACTRNCMFCGIGKGQPLAIDPGEPERISQAVDTIGLNHVIITSVTRDDLVDGGAAQFHNTAMEIKKRAPWITIEVLTPDFQGRQESIDMLLDSPIDIFSHNIETVPRLYSKAREQADYKRSLNLLKLASKKKITKSGIMLGLGERRDEVLSVMQDLRDVGCKLLTIGQYLKPGKACIDVYEFVHPEVFSTYRNEALLLGFEEVLSEPFARTSYMRR